MKKTQLAALFVCNLAGWIVMQGVLGLLPVYAVRLGADPASAGNFLALAFGALTAGTLATGWLSDRFQRRKAMLIAAGIINIPATLLIGQVTEFWQLAVLTVVVFFFIGVSFTTVSILAGLFAGEAERGKVFGVLAVNNSLGALIGGTFSGPIVDQSGFPALFVIASLCWVAQPLLTMLIRDKVVARAAHEPDAAVPVVSALGLRFYLFLLGNFIAFAATFFAVLGRPLMMADLKFDSTAITGAVAVGGAVSLPFAILLGWLSDRFGRFWLIILCFVLGGLGLVVLAMSVTLPHFWIASILLAAIGVSVGIGTAMVTDLVSPEKLGTAISWYGFTPTMGGIFGFAFTGYAIENFGFAKTFIGGAVLTVLAIALLISVRPVRKPALAG